MYLERHQLIASLIFLCVAALRALIAGFDAALPGNAVLLVSLLPILFYRLIAWLSSFGFPEYFARDFGGPNPPGPYAFFFWMLFLIACGVLVFQPALGA